MGRLRWLNSDLGIDESVTIPSPISRWLRHSRMRKMVSMDR
jgi:hypothetical protein